QSLCDMARAVERVRCVDARQLIQCGVELARIDERERQSSAVDRAVAREIFQGLDCVHWRIHRARSQFALGQLELELRIVRTYLGRGPQKIQRGAKLPRVDAQAR